MTTPVQIPDAAVRSASKAYCNHFDANDNHDDAVKAALAAALPHLPLGYEVKKLVWEYICENCLEYQAKTSIGTYSIYNDEDSAGGRMFCQLHLTDDASCTRYAIEVYSGYDSDDTIKDAAQADFERRVRECHVPVSITKSSGCVFNDLGIAKPVDVAAAQEQCARIAENFTGKAHIAHDMRIGIFPEQSKAGVAIAAAIRALSAEPAQHPDDIAVNNFARLMKDKLAKKRNDGRGGWQHMSADELSVILHHCVDKGDPVDIANLCMMLSENGKCIAPAEPAQGEQWQPTHRHVKRGTEYQLIGIGKMQTKNWAEIDKRDNVILTADDQEVAIYRGDDGQLWARPIAEFNDGRFEPLPAAPTSEAGR